MSSYYENDDGHTRDYEVGDKRPPKHGRFKPGVSGNPRGRPKGSVNLRSRITRQLRQSVTVNRNGRPVKMHKGELIAIHSLGQAAKVAWMQQTFGPSEESMGAEVKAAAAEDVQTAVSPEAVEEAVAEHTVETEAAIEKPNKGKKAKAKELSTDVVKQGDVMEADLLQDMIHEIETMKEKEALALLEQLGEQTEMTFFKMGGILSLVQANSWYTPFTSFQAYVENHLGMGYHKATYLVGIYNNLSNSGVPWSKVKDVGWTKLKETAKVVKLENVYDWVKIAMEQNTITLIQTVKKYEAKDAPKALEDQTAKTVTTMTFKVHEDQRATIEAAIAKAKETTGTVVETAALEFVCIDYLNSLSLAERNKAVGLDKALKAIEEAFPSASLTLDMTVGAEAA